MTSVSTVSRANTDLRTENRLEYPTLLGPGQDCGRLLILWPDQQLISGQVKVRARHGGQFEPHPSVSFESLPGTSTATISGPQSGLP